MKAVGLPKMMLALVAVWVLPMAMMAETQAHPKIVREYVKNKLMSETRYQYEAISEHDSIVTEDYYTFEDQEHLYDSDEGLFYWDDEEDDWTLYKQVPKDINLDSIKASLLGKSGKNEPVLWEDKNDELYIYEHFTLERKVLDTHSVYHFVDGHNAWNEIITEKDSTVNVYAPKCRQLSQHIYDRVSKELTHEIRFTYNADSSQVKLGYFKNIRGEMTEIARKIMMFDTEGNLTYEVFEMAKDIEDIDPEWDDDEVSDPYFAKDEKNTSSFRKNKLYEREHMRVYFKDKQAQWKQDTHGTVFIFKNKIISRYASRSGWGRSRIALDQYSQTTKQRETYFLYYILPFVEVTRYEYVY